MDYKGWNVHAYTNTFRDLLRQEPHCRAFRRPTPPHVVKILLDKVHKRVEPHVANPRGVGACVRKMRQRYDAGRGSYVDPQLMNVNIMAILADTYVKLVALNDNSMWRLFGQTLVDMGGTCIQGDSHRLLYLYMSLSSP